MIKQRKQTTSRKTPSGAKRPDKQSKLSAKTLLGEGQFRAQSTANLSPGVSIGFPDRLMCKLRYSESFTFTGSTAPAAQVYIMNSLFDPNFSGAGHQPSYFDTLAAVYTRYYVRGATAQIQLANGSSKAVTYCMSYSDTNDSSNTVEQLSEARYSKTNVIGEAGSTPTKNDDMPYMSTSKVMGQPLAEPDANMYSLVTATPNDVWYLILKVAAIDGSTTVTVNCKVVLIFDCIFKDLLPQISS